MTSGNAIHGGCVIGKCVLLEQRMDALKVFILD